MSRRKRKKKKEEQQPKAPVPPLTPEEEQALASRQAVLRSLHGLAGETKDRDAFVAKGRRLLDGDIQPFVDVLMTRFGSTFHDAVQLAEGGAA